MKAGNSAGVLIGAVIGFVILVAFLTIIFAIPVYFLWNWAAPIYFSGLPPVWHHIPFWHVIGLSFLISFLRSIVFGTPSNKTKSE